MSEQPYPVLPTPLASPHSVDTWPAQQTQTPDTTSTLSQSQGSQSPPSIPDHLVYALPLPALFHQDGHIVWINKDLSDLLGHPAPHLLTGLPCDVLLAHAEASQTDGRGVRVLLRTAHGNVAAELGSTNVSVAEGNGTIWTFSIAGDDHDATPQHQAHLTQAVEHVSEAILEIEDLYEHIWEEEEDIGVDLVSETLLRTMNSANACLERLEAALCTTSFCQMEDALQEAIAIATERAPHASIQLNLTSLPMVRARHEPLRNAIGAVLICAARTPGCQVHLSAHTDLSGHAVLDVHMLRGRITASDIEVCRPMVQHLGASLMRLSDQRVRLRLAPGVQSRRMHSACID